MKLRFLGHSTFEILIESSAKTLLTDPFITPNKQAKSIDVSKLNPDYILVSHGHEDHVADVSLIASRSGATIISNFEIVTWFEEKGLKKGHPMNIGGSWTFDFGEIKCVNAVHSSILPDGSYGGNPMGFILSADSKVIYFAGDTALTEDMKIIDRQNNLDLAILPIGDNFTMGIEDAIESAKMVGVSKVIGMHFNTFDYIKIDEKKAVNLFKDNNIDLILLEIGDSYSI